MVAKDSETHLTDAEIERVQALIASVSLEAVAKRLKIAPQTLRTLAGGLRGHRGTIMLVRSGLAAEEAG